MPGQILNISVYRFAPLTQLEATRDLLKNRALELGIVGTVYVAEEGLNIFLAGAPDAVETYLTFISKQVVDLPEKTIKRSWSDSVSFRRMIVKIKKEIIAFGQPEASPLHATAPYVTPTTLKEWLDSGKEVVLLDTRNDYEYGLGKFEDAITLPIRHFRDLPKHIENLKSLNKKTIVTHCTGGIRCEKAALYLKAQGFEDVYQLEGGILKYLEDCGNAYYSGECFVFDNRVALDATLQPTATIQCFVCRMPLIPAEQNPPLYEIGKHCPYCYDQTKKKEQ